MSVCIGASAAGARAVTATSSAGLAFMWELLYVAASARLPITMAVVNRALTGPININNDHSDSMGARDAGWIQIYAETNQEVYDNYIQAMPISETIRSFSEILEGKHDDIPESYFLNAGSIDDVLARVQEKSAEK